MGVRVSPLPSLSLVTLGATAGLEMCPSSTFLNSWNRKKSSAWEKWVELDLSWVTRRSRAGGGGRSGLGAILEYSRQG